MKSPELDDLIFSIKYREVKELPKFDEFIRGELIRPQPKSPLALVDCVLANLPFLAVLATVLLFIFSD